MIAATHSFGDTRISVTPRFPVVVDPVVGSPVKTVADGPFVVSSLTTESLVILVVVLLFIDVLNELVYFPGRRIFRGDPISAAARPRAVVRTPRLTPAASWRFRRADQ